MQRRILYICGSVLLFAIGCAQPTETPQSADTAQKRLLDQAQLMTMLSQARRVRVPDNRWFEIIELPNRVFAFWEPGHFEKVNSFLIVGRDKDVLYDTGMGIGSIGTAVAGLRRQEGAGDKPLMVINSHNHLDHNGGNHEFEAAWIIRDEWAIERLTSGLAEGFTEYWAGLTPHEGVEVPADFDAQSFAIPPFPEENIRFLSDGDVVDLGDRQFEVIHTTSHSPDGLVLYNAEQKLLFGGDTFYGDNFLVRDLNLLAADLERVSALEIQWHYASHGSQLIEAMRDGERLAAVRRMLRGERTETTTRFAGMEFPLYEQDGVTVTLAADFLTY
ncbi:MAG: MBL fold metallo-hydrolase [Pseudomonadota bacterium]